MSFEPDGPGWRGRKTMWEAGQSREQSQIIYYTSNDEECSTEPTQLASQPAQGLRQLPGAPAFLLLAGYMGQGRW